jgi:succinate dehydrogenase / fumarate reductase, membrane anchor subunit
MQFRSSIAKARGLGSAKSGTSHWWMQRVSAVALIPLSFIVIGFFDLSLNASYQQTLEWLTNPFYCVSLLAWILAVFYHAALGVQVVIEDYVAGEGSKIIGVWTVNLIFMFLTLTALIAVFRIILVG